MVETFLHRKPSFSEHSLSRNKAIEAINHFGQTKTAFLFIISYDTEKTVLFKEPLALNPTDIRFAFPNHSIENDAPVSKRNPTLFFEPPSRENYALQYKRIQEELQKGNIYLLNLTHSTPVHCIATLEEIYFQSTAKYKLYYPDHFVVFSPETFIRIQDGKIYTFPMKGTIRADVPEAKEILRNDLKEQAEHASIVDLLRNDLGQVADSVRVTNYRYFDKVNAGDYDLWQVSSEIEGKLPFDYADKLGDLLYTLLPAGSITGVPKNNAIKIIGEVEDHERGFYTGICGYFDGKNLDSAVMIRFIEQTPHGLVYKSGGGIHQLSNVDSEYQELIQKIYVPVS